MKNLFNYATKELSQDAFLRWLFESWEDVELLPVIRTLLANFCELKNDEDICDVETIAQDRKIDISIYIKTSQRKIALYIEDKTFSSIHDNQLSIYNDNIKNIIKWKNENDERWKGILDSNIYKIFYKTSVLSEQDKTDIETVNEDSTNSALWIPYDIEQIYFLFEKFKNADNYILGQYIKYIDGINKAYKSRTKPTSSNSNIDYIKWCAYFKNIILPNLKNSLQYQVVEKAGPYPYGYLIIRIKDKYPYLEIRTRDCCDNKFKALLLCYGIEKTYSRSEIDEKQARVIETIKNDPHHLFKSENLHHKKGGFPKQIGTYTSEIDVDTDEKFIAELKKCADYYLELMRIWDQ